MRLLISSVTSARRSSDVTTDSSQTSFDLSVAQAVFSVERTLCSSRLTVAWLNAAPPAYVADLAVSLTLRVAVLGEGEDLGALLDWLTGEDSRRSSVSPRIVALAEAVVRIFDANRVSNSWPSLKHFVPRVSLEEFISNPPSGDLTNPIFPITPKTKFLFPFFKLALLIKFFQQKKLLPHFMFVQAWIVALWEVNKNVELYFEGKRGGVEVQKFLFAGWLHKVDKETEAFLELTDRSVWGRLRGYGKLLDEQLDRVARRKGAC